MKRMFMIAVALFAAFSLSAQEPGRFRLVRPDSTRTGSFRLPDSLRVEMSVPDSLAHMSPWKTDFRTAAPMKVKPAVFGGGDSEGEPAFARDRDRQQLAAPWVALQPFERSGVELESVPRCVPRRTDALLPDAPISGVCRCASDAYPARFCSDLVGVSVRIRA